MMPGMNEAVRRGFIIGVLSVVITSSLIALNMAAPATANPDREHFAEPEPSDWVEYMKPLREYMYYRTQAVLNNEIRILWNRYPELQNHVDLTQGINAEQQGVNNLNDSFRLLDANFDVEGYDRIKVKKLSDREVVVLVHGSIQFLRDDDEVTGGELLLEIHLKQEAGRWNVTKTDEYTLPEYKEWIKHNR
jgi:hypothetical protein